MQCFWCVFIHHNYHCFGRHSAKHFIYKPYQILILPLILVDETRTPPANGGAGTRLSEESRVLVPRLPTCRVDFFMFSTFFTLYVPFLFLPHLNSRIWFYVSITGLPLRTNQVNKYNKLFQNEFKKFTLQFPACLEGSLKYENVYIALGKYIWASCRKSGFVREAAVAEEKSWCLSAISCLWYLSANWGFITWDRTYINCG